MSALQGHLFIVHGTIETLVHDAVILPVGIEFRFNSVWQGLAGKRPREPRQWKDRAWGRVVDAPDRVWAVSVGGAVADPYGKILERVALSLEAISARRDARPKVRGQESLPLVAIPVIGIGRGGYGRRRGEVLASLVAHLAEEADRLRLDVALVTPENAVFAAAQYARRSFADVLPARLEDAARELGNAARQQDLALLVGAGVSAAAGLPTWHKLIKRLAVGLGDDAESLLNANLTATDQAELIERLDPEGFQQRVADIAGSVTRSSLLHGLLAGLDCREVITTNYDLLYEQAVRATGRSITSVMPWASAHGADRWVLKLHGDIEHPKTIVLTRRHMVRYDAANRPSAALLQSLLLTKKLLVVGTSMTDDNVIRLAHEVQAYRQEHQGGGAGTFGTVLDTQGDLLRSRLWEGQLDWIALPAVSPWPGRRAVELFLDRVAAHAARDSSWVLDSRFAGLLGDRGDADLADQIRRLYKMLPDRPGTKWSPLVQRLREMGADGAEYGGRI